MMKIWQVAHGPHQGMWAWKIEAPAVKLSAKPGRTVKQAQRNGLTLTRPRALALARRAAALHERLSAGATHDRV